MSEARGPGAVIEAFVTVAENSLIGTFNAIEALLLIVVLLWLAARGATAGTPATLSRDAGLAALSRTPLRSYMTVIGAGIVLRGAMLPWLPPPIPIVPDDFSLFLQAQTFLAGRLANPAHPLGAFFETMYVNQVPAYASMYFPGRSLPLLIGFLLFGHPWLGVWLTMIALAVATVWMLRAWLSPPLALVGGLLVILRFGIFSVWINGYYGGTLTALGGVLVMGSFARLGRGVGLGYAVTLAAGLFLLAVTRPFEGFLFCLPFGAVILAWLIGRKPGLTWRARALLVAPSLLAIVVGGVLLGAYDKATTGSALLTPYELNRHQYAFAPAFLTAEPLAAQRPAPAYLQHYYRMESQPYWQSRTASGIAAIAWRKMLTVALFYIGPALIIPFLLGLGSWRRFRVPAAGTVAVLGGFAVTTWDWAQYIAPAFGFFMLVIVLGLERLETVTWRGRTIGASLSVLLPALVVLTLLVPLAVTASGAALPYSAMRACCVTRLTLNPITAIIDRGPTERLLLATPGPDLVLVRLDPRIDIWVTWVANGPDIDASPIIWANDLGPERNRHLLARYPQRRIWTVRVQKGEVPHLVELKRDAVGDTVTAAIR